MQDTKPKKICCIWCGKEMPEMNKLKLCSDECLEKYRMAYYNSYNKSLKKIYDNRTTSS